MFSVNFHIFTVPPAIVNVFHYQLMHKRIASKGVLKFALKLQQLQLFQCDHHHQGGKCVSLKTYNVKTKLQRKVKTDKTTRCN